MWPVSLGSAKRVLCLGAHSDDIEIGAGGTLQKLIEDNPALEVYWVVFSAPEVRLQEARDSASEYLLSLKNRVIKVFLYEESYFPGQWANIKKEFEIIKSEFEPDLIFTHYREDRHQDHRVLSDLTYQAFRDHLILEYEIFKYDGDLGTPNVYVLLSERFLARKTALLLSHFKSQATTKHWFSTDSFNALARLRGIECASLYAEAFYCRKLVLNTPTT